MSVSQKFEAINVINNSVFIFLFDIHQ